VVERRSLDAYESLARISHPSRRVAGKVG
jgi:hypothetical protein